MRRYRYGYFAILAAGLTDRADQHRDQDVGGALVESDRAHRRRSTVDSLTGLFNRNALEQRLAELDAEIPRVREGVSHALLLCDLDHFKRVNDEFGHAAGDAFLQDVAYTMRAGDSISPSARWKRRRPPWPTRRTEPAQHPITCAANPHHVFHASHRKRDSLDVCHTRRPEPHRDSLTLMLTAWLSG